MPGNAETETAGMCFSYAGMSRLNLRSVVGNQVQTQIYPNMFYVLGMLVVGHTSECFMRGFTCYRPWTTSELFKGKYTP